MDLHFERHCLGEQAARLLEGRIREGQWVNRLPSERELCEEMQVSRTTLRLALAVLRQKSLIRSVPRRGFFIVQNTGRAPGRERTIALLFGQSWDMQFGDSYQTIIRLMEHYLSKAGYRLEVHTFSGWGVADTDRRLKDLTERKKVSGWILYCVPETAQQWFQRRRIPAMVLGSCYPGIQLCYADTDHRAICRHAAQTLLRLGHRRIALVTFRNKYGGDILGERGFGEAFQSLPGRKAEAMVWIHDETSAGLCRTLQRMRIRPRPTGLVVLRAKCALTAAGCLGQWGLRLPRDVSLICDSRMDYLDWHVPPLARYVINEQSFIQKSARLMLCLAAGRAQGVRSLLVIPRFLKGGSVGPAPVS